MKLIMSVLSHAALRDLWVKNKISLILFPCCYVFIQPLDAAISFIFFMFISLCLASVLTAAASAAPKLCPAGTFSSLVGRRMLSECQPCPSGFYCEVPGLSAPTGECWEGKSWINHTALQIDKVSEDLLKVACVCVCLCVLDNFKINVFLWVTVLEWKSHSPAGRSDRSQRRAIDCTGIQKIGVTFFTISKCCSVHPSYKRWLLIIDS